MTVQKHINETNNNILQKSKWIFEKENIKSTNRILPIIETVLTNEYSQLKNNIDYFKSIAIEDTCESIQYIPCNLLCILSEEIIRLTAIKQKISSEEEYVSITSHISLVTKSHGFKWIKFNNEIL
nr:hypothetical protein [uncultured Methanobrevibacter sp.]